MKVKVIALLFVGVLAVSAGLSVTSLAQQVLPFAGLKLYDSFDHGLINPTKWFSQNQCGFGPIMECDS